MGRLEAKVERTDGLANNLVTILATVKNDGEHKVILYYLRMIYLGADHRGYFLKEKIKAWLSTLEYDFLDLGASSYDKEDDYPDIGIRVGEKVVEAKGKGILICGSGIGACVAANKVPGVRAGLCLLAKQAAAGRNDDDMNILCINADLVSDDDNREILRVFLETPFGAEERYVRRINKMKQYEAKKCS